MHARGRDPERQPHLQHHRVQAVISGLVAARPDTVVLEMGLPLWVPPAGVHVATYGAARANAQAAAEVLGLAG
jgi:beta-N-acetylhexosaminidase